MVEFGKHEKIKAVLDLQFAENGCQRVPQGLFANTQRTRDFLVRRARLIREGIDNHAFSARKRKDFPRDGWGTVARPADDRTCLYQLLTSRSFAFSSPKMVQIPVALTCVRRHGKRPLISLGRIPAAFGVASRLSMMSNPPPLGAELFNILLILPFSAPYQNSIQAIKRMADFLLIGPRTQTHL